MPTAKLSKEEDYGNPQLQRNLGLIDTGSLLVGTVIGGGIFLVPGLISRALPSARDIVLLWIFGGILSFFGALAYAELGTMFPSTGGQYVFVREAFGRMAAFLFGWTTFIIVMPAQIGSLAVGFSVYLGHFWEMSAITAKIASVTLIAFLATANYVGVRSGVGVQNTCTAMKMAGLAIITVSAFLSPSPAPHEAEVGVRAWHDIGLALVPCMLAYDGWNMVSFVTGEIRDPQRTFPRALALGIGTVALTYVLFNVAVIRVLPLDVIRTSERVGATLAEKTLGPAGASLVTLTILFSVAGSLNAALMTPPRLYFAQARDGLLFRSLGNVHPRFRTPSTAILVQGVLGALAAAIGSFSTLITYAIFASWAFYVVTIAALIALRATRPELPRPFRMWGYPITALLFIAAAIGFLASTALSQPWNALGATVLIAAGVPAYAFWSRRSSGEPQRGPRPAASQTSA